MTALPAKAAGPSHNILDSNSKVQRFMILGSARTGSNLLLSLLSAHPQIKTYSELFNLDTLPRESLIQALEDPVSFLRQRVYETNGPEIAAVGFKMFYDHLTRDYLRKPVDPSKAPPRLHERITQFSVFIERNYAWETLEKRFQSTWEFLYSDRSLAVIHLKRRNMLHTLISLKTAFATDRWWTLDSSPQRAPAVRLDPEECRRYFHMQDNFAAGADRDFQGHPKIEVAYEDLAAKQQETMQQIFTFLHVPSKPVTTRMRKQNLAPAWETVANYHQLKDHFRHTKWDIFFG